MQLVLSTPVYYSLELTPACNNHCPGCSNVFIDDKFTRQICAPAAPLSAAQWNVILAKIKPYAERVKLTGGEPTLHPEFKMIVRDLAERDLPFSLFTNARWRNPDTLVAWLKTIPQCVGLLISLHGADAATHEAYTGVRGSFDETVTNIQRAVRAGLNVATSTVITRQNHNHIAKIVAMVTGLGVDHSVINRYLGAQLPGIEPDDAELRIAVQTVEQLRQAGARVKHGTCVPQCFTENSSTGCLAGVAYCAISPWGEMRPCNHSPTQAGNLLTQSVKQVWQSAAMAHWREKMPVECSTQCSAYSVCHGACRAQIEVRSELCDPLRGDPIRFLPRPKPVTYYENLRPINAARMRQESFGYVLVRANKLAPIASQDVDILAACNGISTLREIQNQFGARGLHLVVGLHEKGLIEFVEAQNG